MFKTYEHARKVHYTLTGNCHQRRKQVRVLQKDSKYHNISYFDAKAVCYLKRVGGE